MNRMYEKSPAAERARLLTNSFVTRSKPSSPRKSFYWAEFRPIAPRGTIAPGSVRRGERAWPTRRDYKSKKSN